MKKTDFAGLEIERLQREAMGHSRIFEQLDAARKMMAESSAYSAAKEFIDHENRWKNEIEKHTRPYLAMDHIAHHKTAIENMTGTSAIQEAARRWNETSDLAAAASSMNMSLEGIASKIAREFEASQRLENHQLGLSASQTLASSLVSERAIARLSGYAQTLQSDVLAMSKGLQVSFSLAQIAGTAGIEKAVAASIGNIASQYADQFDVKSRLRQMVEGMSAFDLATTAAIARFHGVDGLARQMAALGIDADEYLDDEDIEAQRSEAIVHPQGGLSGVSLEVLQQILINLIAAYIWALFIAPTMPNPDLDTQNRKIARVESLIEKLPQLIEAQVETIIRQQLFAADSYFVVNERTARLRKMPEDGSSVLALAFPNQKLKLLEERRKWIKVEFFDYLAQSMREGWVLKKYCTRLPRLVDDRQPNFEVKGSNVTTRQAMDELDAGIAAATAKTKL